MSQLTPYSGKLVYILCTVIEINYGDHVRNADLETNDVTDTVHKKYLRIKTRNSYTDDVTD